MTQFQRRAPVAYMNTMASVRRGVARFGARLPWFLTVAASVMLLAVLIAHAAAGPVPSSGVLELGPVSTVPIPPNSQPLSEDRIARLAKAVDRLSAKFDETSQSTIAARELQRELAALSETVEALKLDLATVSKHAMQVESSISNIDVNVSTPEVLTNKLQRQNKGLTRP